MAKRNVRAGGNEGSASWIVGVNLVRVRSRVRNREETREWGGSGTVRNWKYKCEAMVKIVDEQAMDDEQGRRKVGGFMNGELDRRG